MRDVPKNRISERALTVWKISALISSIIGWVVTIAVLVLTIIFDWTFWIFAGLLVLSVIETILSIFVLPNLKWKRWRYEVHEHEIDLQRGVFIVKRTIIPMNRVQHVDTQQGPLLRKYHLATVSVTTAATVHEIPALDLEEADQLRDYISRLARVDEDDV
ncbi:PH domain-containing protein [Ferdinandcohnia quinoae]|uniref:PH domain-containing protein n=1 Tax=Fredinandcohnia quinoae TaxID=2918902 RepID=A0AAW5E8J0_9BACI|nr:PH domain-containing protein [Fredinandcohnia sp. SECRCQ15]MCH1627259.1 PH domain-containing protein [Fredinandcohnia sp. SECRCQ15]